jgi:Domain of unknown function (DUF4118)
MTRDRVALVLAPLLPLAMSALLFPLRGNFVNTHAALLMVLSVGAVAANGYRRAGVIASISATLYFDFFFTQPYERLTIHDPVDVETSVLLLIVGLGVSELAVWGRRQQTLASRHAGYLAGIQAAAEVGALGGSSSLLLDHVSGELNRALKLRRSRFQPGAAGLGNPPRLRRDGQVEWKNAIWDVESRGLPIDSEIELLVESGGRLCGRFLLQAAPDTRISLAERRVAVALADQVGAVLR